jgi:hypothetical protein
MNHLELKLNIYLSMKGVSMVSFIIPTYADKAGLWRKLFLEKMIPSLVNLKGFKFKLLINFMNYKLEDINEALYLIDQYTDMAEVRYSRKNYKPPVSMCWIRENICKLDPYADIYINMDDDLKFNNPSVAKAYGQVEEFMRINPKCGMVMCMGFLGGTPSGKNIVPTNDRIWNTRHGLFLRNVKEDDWLFVPKDGTKCKGGLEETYAVYSRMDLGYWGAKLMNVNVTHRTSKGIDKQNFKPVERYNPETDIHNPTINSEGIGALIKKKWDDPQWEHSKKKLPNLLARKVKMI